MTRRLTSNNVDCIMVSITCVSWLYQVTTPEYHWFMVTVQSSWLWCSHITTAPAPTILLLTPTLPRLSEVCGSYLPYHWQCCTVTTAPMEQYWSQQVIRSCSCTHWSSSCHDTTAQVQHWEHCCSFIFTHQLHTLFSLTSLNTFMWTSICPSCPLTVTPLCNRIPFLYTHTNRYSII